MLSHSMSSHFTPPVISKSSSVLVAPVAAESIASAAARPHLLRDVAFAARQRPFAIMPGTPVFIYAAPDFSAFHPLLRKGFVTWRATLTRIVPAVTAGPRRGMHPDARVRPPFAEAYDYRDATFFWHVADLAPLDEPIAFGDFRDDTGLRLLDGLPPQALVRAHLPREPAAAQTREAA